MDGGTISNCDNQWTGIIIEGNANLVQLTNPLGALIANRAGTVVLQNGSIIENAKNAVSCDPTHLGSDPDFFGGLVDAEDATFIECNRAVAFMDYGDATILDRSQFVNCNFVNLNYGVTNWASDGVYFNDCSFDNIVNTGILCIDAAITVENGCTFTNLDTGISLDNTNSVVNSSIIRNIGILQNEFETNNAGILLEAPNNAEQIVIENNIFNGGGWGILSQGTGFLLIQFNDFLNNNSYATQITSSGSGPINQVEQNNYFQAGVGNVAVNNNSSLRYFDNCFELTNYWDIYVTSGSQINPNQHGGNLTIEAGNCFSKGGVPEILNNGLTVDYYILNNRPIMDCETLQNSTGVNEEDTNDENSNGNCGASFPSLCGTDVNLSGV